MIDHDFFQPETKSRITPEITDFSVSRHKSLLQDILGIHPVGQQADGDIVHGFRVQLIQPVLRLCVALPAFFDQLLMNVRFVFRQFSFFDFKDSKGTKKVGKKTFLRKILLF